MKISVKTILVFQAVVMLYTLSSVAAKLAAGQPPLSQGFLLFYGVEIVLLGIYALAWQQVIKHWELSVAYANRSMAILWSLIWAVVFFRESVTINNIIGVVIVFLGTMLVNQNDE